MTFLEKLDLMMNARGLNKRQLSILSGVPYTTIDGYYKRGYENAKIANVRKIAKALGVSLNFLLEEEQDQTESPGTAEAIPGDQDEIAIMNFLSTLSPDQEVYPPLLPPYLRHSDETGGRRRQRQSGPHRPRLRQDVEALRRHPLRRSPPHHRRDLKNVLLQTNYRHISKYPLIFKGNS